MNDFILYYLQKQEGNNMNEFEKDPQDKNLEVPHAAAGFIYSFVFFVLIYVIGATIALIN